MSTTKREPLGKLPREAIGALDLPDVPADLLEGFRSLPDLTGMCSDAMDQLGIERTVPSSLLHPTSPKARLIGRALTVKNRRSPDTLGTAVAKGVSQLAEIEAHHLAVAGDVLVIEGVDGISNMGSISATTGHSQGEIGAIVDGAVRDIDHSRAIGYPIWSRGVSPITGKWRIRTESINKPVQICGVAVMPGDLVLADEVGVCFVPHERMRDVLAIALSIKSNEHARQNKLSEQGAGNELRLAREKGPAR